MEQPIYVVSYILNVDGFQSEHAKVFRNESDLVCWWIDIKEVGLDKIIFKEKFLVSANNATDISTEQLDFLVANLNKGER